MTDRAVLTIIPTGERRLRIAAGTGREIGQIFGRAVRFFGFESESQIIEAVRRAWRALEPIRLRDGHRPVHPRELGDLRFVHDGAHEWISDGVIPLARIIRPSGDAPDIGSYAVEWVVPAHPIGGVSLEAVHTIASALHALTPSRSRRIPPTRIRQRSFVEKSKAARDAGRVRGESYG